MKFYIKLLRNFSKKRILFFFFIFNFLYVFSQNSSVSGIVVDSNGIPLPGVNVLVKGMSIGASTDFDGYYNLENLPNDATELIFSSVGMTTQEILIDGRTNINITLVDDLVSLDEIVVVGYGVQKKSDINGSVSVIDVDKAITQPTSDFSEMLRGQAAGVRITQNSARPGGSSNIVIRGRNSILGGNSPLFVVDGVPTDNIQDLNTDDIESIEVLKDASSQAIYGARASNGVILVTTKKANEGKLKVSFSSFVASETLQRNFELYNPPEWVQLRREAFRTANDNGQYEYDDFVFSDLQIDVIQNGNYVNWEDLTMQDGQVFSNNLSLRGGDANTKTYINLGYFDHSGIIPGSNYKRGSIRAKLDQKVNDKFNLSANLYLTSRKENKESGSLNWTLLPPVAKAFDDDGEILRYPLGDFQLYNPLWNMREYINDFESNKMSINLIGQYSISESLKYRMNAYFYRNNAFEGEYLTSKHQGGVASTGRATIINFSNKEYLIENILTYNKSFDEENNMDITFVQSINETGYSFTRTRATGFATDYLGYNGIQGAENNLQVIRNANERAILSFMGRLRYNLKDRYLLTATARYDGSSVFSQNNKWGFFPSVALGWKIHKEDFLNENSDINELKFRLSYGSVGNQAISPYQTLGIANQYLYVFGGETNVGYLPGTDLPNPNLRWETSTTLNAGLDFGFFKNILTGSIELYNTKTTDLLVNRTVAGSLGYNTTTYNVGETKNYGTEILLSADIIREENLSWNVTGTFANNKNEIVALYGEVDEFGNLMDDVSRERFIGHPINVIYQYAFDGIWQVGDDIANSHMPDAQPGDIRVRDVSGPNGVPDGELTADDKIIINQDPDWFGSISSSLKYKQFELFTDFYFVQGAKKSNSYLAAYEDGGTLQGNFNGIKVDYYTPENPSNTYPRPNRTTPSFLYALAVQDASFIKLRTLQLSYHMPESVVSFLNLDSFKIYASATNLITLTDYKSYNPEVNPGAYPDGREITVGIKLDL